MVVTDLTPNPAYKDFGVAWLGKAQEHPIPLCLIFSFTYPSVLLAFSVSFVTHYAGYLTSFAPFIIYHAVFSASSASFVTYRAVFSAFSASFVIPAKAGIQVHCNGKPISFRCHSRESGNPGVNA